VNCEDQTRIKYPVTDLGGRRTRATGQTRGFCGARNAVVVYGPQDHPEGNAMKPIRRQLLQVAGAAVTALGVNAPSWGAEPTIAGSWKLVSAVSEELATRKKTALLGEHPKGYIIYTPQGRVMALAVHEIRSPPKVDEDRINLHKYMYSYSGRYTVEGEKVIHHVDVSWNESWTGTEQVRFFKLDGDSLTITTAPQRNAITGIENISVFVWERER
jgi:hypothetical protein